MKINRFNEFKGIKYYKHEKKLKTITSFLY
jgi:hypothetical protein